MPCLMFLVVCKVNQFTFALDTASAGIDMGDMGDAGGEGWGDSDLVIDEGSYWME